jgi:hypothetical protein
LALSGKTFVRNHSNAIEAALVQMRAESAE